MTNRGAVRPVGARPDGRARLARTMLGLLLTVLTGLALAVPQAAAAPAAPVAPVPAATASPTATPTGQTPSGSPTRSSRATPRPDPEGDRWVELAVVGGGSLLGAVVMFMLIGGLIRWRNRRRYRG